MIGGIETEGILVIVIYIMIRDIVIPLIRKFRPNFLNTKSNNPYMFPGKGETCIKHGEKLAKIETEIIGLKEDIERLDRKLDERRK